jgi:uncharacterized protein YuzE
MRTTYDSWADAAYIYLREIEPGGVKETVMCVGPDDTAAGSVNLDFDHEGKLVGIEILRASRSLPKEFLGDAERLGPPRKLSDPGDA